MNTLCMVVLAGLFLFQQSCGCCGARTGLNTPSPTATPTPGGGGRCCNTPTPFGPILIGAQADQVPTDLHGCGFHGEEITSIAISGTIVGCPETGDITFPTLQVVFTTDRARCGGQGVRTSTVKLANVHYRGTLRLAGAPACVADSSVDPFEIVGIDDPGFNTLFLTNGRGTLRPILATLALRWASSPPETCPPSQGVGTTPGNRPECPR